MMEKVLSVLEQPVCDNCLGRQFARLMHGYSNKKRGQVLRLVAGMEIDSGVKHNVDMSNFDGFVFHSSDLKPKKRKKCLICKDFFLGLDRWVDKILKYKGEYKTFLVGTKVSDDLLAREEELWERIGIEHCEQFKAEVNREVGKLVEAKTKAKCDLKSPDVTFVINLINRRLEIQSNPLFIYGEYQKLKRGIPQTKWPSGKYKTSVEQIIAKPIMAKIGGKGHKLHGCGREDLDARCLGWRPFVLEILEPDKRILPKIKFPASVKVRKLRLSDMAEVREIKEARPDKTYKLVIEVPDGIEKKELVKLKGMIGEIEQKTPARVLHRRADLRRKRKVLDIKTKFLTKKKFEFVVRGEAGLYVKELVHGDEGRTKPNVSELLGKECKVKELDVIGIHL
jgi:tRNA pseudouridine synthase 10